MKRREVFFLKLQTVRVRRSRPSTLSLALALMITMLCVYLGTLASLPKPAADTASAGTFASVFFAASATNPREATEPASEPT